MSDRPILEISPPNPTRRPPNAATTSIDSPGAKVSPPKPANACFTRLGFIRTGLDERFCLATGVAEPSVNMVLRTRST